MSKPESANISDHQRKHSFWKKALLTNLVVIFGIVVLLAAFFASPWGNPLYKTLLLTTEAVPNFPVKPLKPLTKGPIVQEVKFKAGDREVVADLYRPNDDGKHPAIIFTLGILYHRDNPNVTKFAQALSRIGFVVLVPDLPDFLTGFVWEDSIETLVSGAQFLDALANVAKGKIGFVGFCVGGSISIVAAQDDKISDKIAYVAAISPYFDGRDLALALLGRSQEINGERIQWSPSNISREVLVKGTLHYLPDLNERNLLAEYILQSKELDNDRLDKLSEDGRSIHRFLTKSGSDNFQQYYADLPNGLKTMYLRLSPSSRISSLKAKLIVLNDEQDSFVPRAEGEKFAQNLSKNQIHFYQIDSFEHVNPKTNLPRWAAIRQLWHIGRFVKDIIRESQ